jgi:AcrR family transcriptional regulator
VTPRAYRLGQRQHRADETRERIVAAARELLSAPGGVTALTIDAVARQAGVARMTVYHQLGSKQGMLQALFDSLAQRGGIYDLADAFHKDDALGALSSFIATFTRFWASDRLVFRRLHGLAATDPELGEVLHARQEWRREALVALLKKHRQEGGPRPTKRIVDVLYMLTSFEAFDLLADDEFAAKRVGRELQQLALAALGSRFEVRGSRV